MFKPFMNIRTEKVYGFERIKTVDFENNNTTLEGGSIRENMDDLVKYIKRQIFESPQTKVEDFYLAKIDGFIKDHYDVVHSSMLNLFFKKIEL
jgi:hypothetical protein